MLETLDHTIRIGSTPTFLYFDLYLYSAYAAHYVYNRACTRARSYHVVFTIGGTTQTEKPKGYSCVFGSEASEQINAARRPSTSTNYRRFHHRVQGMHGFQ